MNDITQDAARARSVMDWPAIFAGAVIAAGATLVFAGFTAAIGLGSVSAETGEGLGWFATFIMGVFAFLAMMGSYALGGYVSGRMRSRTTGIADDETKARDGAHGLTVWAVGTILGAIMSFGILSSGVKVAGQAASTVVETAGSAVGGALQGAGQLAGGVVGGVGQLAGGAISGVGQLAGGAAQGAGQAAGQGGLQDMLPQGMQQNPMDYLTDRLLRSEQSASNSFSNEAIRREVTSIVGNVVRTGELSDDDRAYLEKAVAARTDLTEAEVKTRVDQAVTEVQDLRDTAQQKIDEAQAAAKDALDKARAEAEDLRAQAEQKIEEARQAAIDAAEAARHAAVWTALLLAVSSLVAAVVAFLAAIKGGEDRDTGRVWGGLTHTGRPRRS